MAFERQRDVLAPQATPHFPPSRTPEEAFFQHVLARMMARRPDARFPNLQFVKHHLRALVSATQPLVAGRELRPGAYELAGVPITIECGDLARVETDAIVNSSASSMRMDQGLGLALVRRGGQAIEDEALAGGEHALGECVATGPGTLDCTNVLHAVGAWNEVSCVARATHRALLLAEELGHTRIAMPAIGTGRGRVTIEACADAMAAALRLHLCLGGSRLHEIRILLIDERTRCRFEEIAGPVLLGFDAVPPDPDAPLLAGDATGETLFAKTGPTR
jgi:serine/threonine-protein kinase